MIARRASLCLQMSFLLKRRFALDAIVSGDAAHQLASLPICQNPVDVLAGDASYGGKIRLAELLPNDDAASTDLLTEMLGHLKQRQRDPAAQRRIGPC